MTFPVDLHGSSVGFAWNKGGNSVNFAWSMGRKRKTTVARTRDMERIKEQSFSVSRYCKCSLILIAYKYYHTSCLTIQSEFSFHRN